LTNDMKAIEVENLTKVYGRGTIALDGISFTVDEGEIFGLLGPNGAGKTTAIKIITTLIKPALGTARVFGMDVQKHPQQVRQMIGYVPQAVSVDGDLTGYENLLIFSKLFYVDPKERQSRITEALDFMDLTARADDLVKHYSGGMMRRLEIAQALVNRPRILLLDEPSIGLDPFSKNEVKDQVKELNKELNMTMIVTTHDMTEADEICDRVAIMNAGRIAVIDTPTRLKESVGGDIITVKLSQNAAAITLPQEVGRLLSFEGGEMRVLTQNGEGKIPRIIDFLEAKGMVIDSISLAKPTLDDVFIKYAGSRVDKGGYVAARSERRTFARRGR
jgi:ABC-2 type transport system ATP-binding protein